MRRAVLALGLLLLLSACGFQLRGAYQLPFARLHLALPDTSEIGAGLKRAIRASAGTTLVATASEADASLVPTLDMREKAILSLSGSGRVREVRLNYRYGYRLIDRYGREVVPAQVIHLVRDMTYDDTVVLSKEQEENTLWRDMQQDAVQQIMRRLGAARPLQLPPPEPAS